MTEFSGKKLKQLRKQHGYSIREFADKIYTAKSSVQRWETSVVPNNEDLIASIAEACNMSVSELIAYLSDHDTATALPAESGVTTADTADKATEQTTIATPNNAPTIQTSTDTIKDTEDIDSNNTAKQLKQSIHILLACGCFAVALILMMLVLKFVNILN